MCHAATNAFYLFLRLHNILQIPVFCEPQTFKTRESGTVWCCCGKVVKSVCKDSTEMFYQQLHYKCVTNIFFDQYGKYIEVHWAHRTVLRRKRLLSRPIEGWSWYSVCCLSFRKRRPEKVIGVHMQLSGALLCLHLSFLLCCFWVWLFNKEEEDWVCRFLGLFLHWSLMATFCWTALEGFHLYLLLVQVFNIYVRRYLLKLSLVGWGEWS